MGWYRERGRVEGLRRGRGGREFGGDGRGDEDVGGRLDVWGLRCVGLLSWVELEM